MAWVHTDQKQASLIKYLSQWLFDVSPRYILDKRARAEVSSVQLIYIGSWAVHLSDPYC